MEKSLEQVMEPAKFVKLDLGCGKHKQAGFTGVDMGTDIGADVVHDLRVTPWPFESDSVDEVHCSHFFEHLDGSERIKFMAELYRVLKVGAKVTMITPHWSSMRSVQDPTHKWPPVCEATYLYFNKKWRDENGIHYVDGSDFDFTYGYSIAPQWQTRNQEMQQFALGNYLNAAQDIFVTLIKKA